MIVDKFVVINNGKVMMGNKIRDFFDYICNFEYGWQDKYGNMHDRIDKSYYDTFVFRSVFDVKKSNVGVCWEIVEIEREFFNNNDINHKIIFVLYNDIGYHSHTFSVYEYMGKYYWFEAVLKDYKGIYEFNSLNELLDNVKDNFKYIKLNEKYDKNKIEFYEYEKPLDITSCQDFYDYCMKSKRL